MVAAAKAATITVTNVDFTETNAIVSKSGTVYADKSGFVGIGVFSIADAQIAGAGSAATIANNFTLFGQSDKIGAGFSLDGTYQFISTAEIGVGSPYTGNIYTVIGNATTLATSTEFLVFKHDLSFNPDSPLGGPPAMVKAGRGTLILGGFNNFTHFIGLPSGPAPAFNTVTVPEPSATLLGLLGAVGLLRRRR